MAVTQAHLDALAHDLRQIVARLAGAERDGWYPSTLPTVIEMASNEQTRSDAILAVVQQMLSMEPGDKVTFEWHGLNLGNPVAATLTLTKAAQD